MELIQGNDINDMMLLWPRVNTDNLKVVRKIGIKILYKYFISDPRREFKALKGLFFPFQGTPRKITH